MGINKNSKIIVFDNLGVYSSPRVWWMFKIMGHENVFVLDGGLPEWIKKGFEVCYRKVQNYKAGNFKAVFYEKYVKTYKSIIANINTPKFLIIDARSKERFNGIKNEPRKSLKSGHIPNSINIPYTCLLNNTKFKSSAEIKNIFNDKCPHDKELVFSCGSGITACIVMLANEIRGARSRCVYDGSWSEWIQLQNL